MLKLDKGNGTQGAPDHATTGLFYPQFVTIPGPLAGQMQLMLVPGSGIPMRDYFAARAMETLFSDLLPAPGERLEAWALECYRIADKMIEARKTEKPFNNSQFHEDHMSK